MYHNNFSVWVLVPPRFVAEPEHQAVIPKSTVLFRSVFEGTSPFMVKWFKDDIELITGPSCMIRLEKYSSSVELYSVGTLQCGIYSCQISNEAGTVKSAAELLVKGWTILFFVHHHHRHTINSIFFSSIFTALFLHFNFLRHFFSYQEYPCCLQSHLPSVTASSHVSISSIHHTDAQVLL